MRAVGHPGTVRSVPLARDDRKFQRRLNFPFCRIHKTLRVTPAMEAGITDHFWTVEEIVNLLDRNLSNQTAA